MVRERWNRWGFDMGGDRFSGIFEGDETTTDLPKPQKPLVTIRDLAKGRDKENIKIINPFKK